jgi:hypothetical protein
MPVTGHEFAPFFPGVSVALIADAARPAVPGQVRPNLAVAIVYLVLLSSAL